jgi:hypothetical protein
MVLLIGRAAYTSHGLNKDTCKHIVAIAGIHLLADFANLQASYLILDSLGQDYESIGGQASALADDRSLSVAHFESEVPRAASLTQIPDATTTLSAVVGATLGLVGMFRADVDYHGEKTVVDALAFEIALAAEIKARGATKVFVPDLMVIPAMKAVKDSLQDRLDRVQRAKAKAWASVGPLVSELVRIEGELDQAVANKDQAAVDALSREVSDMRRDLAPVADPLSRLDQRLSELQIQWNQVDSSSGLLQLARLLRAEAIKAEKPLFLHATVVSSGGFYRISRNLFRMFFMGDGLSFAGGATVRWALLNHDGSVEKGQIIVLGLKGRFARRNRHDFEM